MDPRHLFMDGRLSGMCAYCGASPDTRDHVPPKVMLDKPYPLQLSVVPACESCNAAFSLDEQYLACFIECVICGTVETAGLQRQTVQRILDGNSMLRYRIKRSRRTDYADNLVWEPEVDRVRNVVLKLARGHAAYELYPKLEEPLEVTFAPLSALSDPERIAFENLTPRTLKLWPELGSRAFVRALGNRADHFEQRGDWIVVQHGRYRYSVAELSGVIVRMVLSEYLACQVSWEE